MAVNTFEPLKYVKSSDTVLQASSEPFVETEFSMAVVVDEYDPMRPNDYEECKQKQREKEQRDREIERSQRDDDR